MPELESRGHTAIPVDIREDDPALGLAEYADITLAAIGSRTDSVLVAQSMGAFTAAMVATRVPVAAIVLHNAMVPLPGETSGQWWGAVGSQQARRDAALAGGWSTEFDLDTYFLHDVPPHVLAGVEDRFFPLDLQRRVAADRLGLEVDVRPGGHLLALSHPAELADRLAGYL